MPEQQGSGQWKARFFPEKRDQNQKSAYKPPNSFDLLILALLTYRHIQAFRVEDSLIIAAQVTERPGTWEKESASGVADG